MKNIKWLILLILLAVLFGLWKTKQSSKVETVEETSTWEYEYAEDGSWIYATNHSRKNANGQILTLRLHQLNDHFDVWMTIEGETIEGTFTPIRFDGENPINYGISTNENGTKLAVSKAFLDRLRQTSSIDVEFDTQNNGYQLFRMGIYGLK